MYIEARNCPSGVQIRVAPFMTPTWVLEQGKSVTPQADSFLSRVRPRAVVPRSLRCLLGSLDAMLPMRPYKPRKPGRKQDSDHQIELVKVLAHRAPILT